MFFSGQRSELTAPQGRLPAGTVSEAWEHHLHGAPLCHLPLTDETSSCQREDFRDPRGTMEEGDLWGGKEGGKESQTNPLGKLLEIIPIFNRIWGQILGSAIIYNACPPREDGPNVPWAKLGNTCSIEGNSLAWMWLGTAQLMQPSKFATNPSPPKGIGSSRSGANLPGGSQWCLNEDALGCAISHFQELQSFSLSERDHNLSNSLLDQLAFVSKPWCMQMPKRAAKQNLLS